MATISKRGEKQWQAKVRMKGYPPMSRTFDYKADAEKWAMATERELQTAGFIDRREAEKTPLVAVLRRYAKEITPQKKGNEAEAVRIEVMLRDPVLSHLKMAALTSATLAEWRDRRRQEVSGASVAREMTILSAVINHARREWNITIENPLPYVSIEVARTPARVGGRNLPPGGAGACHTPAQRDLQQGRHPQSMASAIGSVCP